MPAPMRKCLWWYKLCWILVWLCASALLVGAPALLVSGLFVAAALAGGASAAYLERVRPTIVADFVWFAASAALLLFPLALAIHTVRVYRLSR
ncbi:hypothetical protein [Cupriavidus taiwanensis]|uniref:Uncharacterized protein n=1 Tax=Cupriavidus taiwanensis TaxID=164546 RepID=A0A375J6J6_9BURK|nr:hypothetical protein [Cupriavidus taiwanensis]SPS00795.1 exported hypothetical protein [Cupriavidus taiwanensis]